MDASILSVLLMLSAGAVIPAQDDAAIIAQDRANAHPIMLLDDVDLEELVPELTFEDTLRRAA